MPSNPARSGRDPGKMRTTTMPSMPACAASASFAAMIPIPLLGGSTRPPMSPVVMVSNFETADLVDSYLHQGKGFYH
jgi:hypothetical protein